MFYNFAKSAGKNKIQAQQQAAAATSHLSSSPNSSIRVFGTSVESDLSSVRHQMGVVFQSPSVDGKLTVFENLRLQASLYGLAGKIAGDRIVEVSEQLGISRVRTVAVLYSLRLVFTL